MSNKDTFLSLKVKHLIRCNDKRDSPMQSDYGNRNCTLDKHIPTKEN